MRTIASPVVLKRLTRADSGEFSGLASTPDLDRAGHRVLPEAYRRSVAAFTAGTLVVPILANHDHGRQIGSVSALQIGPEGLLVEAQLALGTEAGREAFERMKAGPVALSVGFVPRDGGMRTEADGTTTFLDVDLHEISVVAVGANPAARSITVKAADRFPTPRDFERALRERLQLSAREAKLVTSLAFHPLTGASAERDEPDDDPTLAAIAASLETLRKTYGD